MGFGGQVFSQERSERGEKMKECANCGFLNDYGACDCPHSDKWYACPIEAKKPENRKALEEYAEWVSRREDKA